MIRTLNCHSLSQIPPVSTFDKNEKVFLTLPVMVLAYQKLKTGVLLVTDFTEIPELGFANNVLPHSLPDLFIFKNGPLSPFKVLALGVPHGRIESLWSQLQLYGPHMKSYDYSQSDKSNLLSAGIIAIVNIKINEYRGYLEGLLCSLDILTRKRINDPGCLGNVTVDMFDLFMSRFGRNLNLKLYDTVVQSFPIEKYISRPALQEVELSQAEVLPNQSRRYVNYDSNPLETKKFRRLNPSEAVYKQQVTQPPGADAKVFTQNDQSARYRCNFSSQESSQVESQELLDLDVSQSEWQRNRMNDVSFLRFCNLKCYEMEPGTSFRFDCHVKSMSPLPEDVFVKAFRETLKIAQMSFVITDGNKTCTIEINTTDEGCNFFELEEEEEAINHIGKLHRSLQALFTKKITLEVEAKTMVLPLGHILMYWCPSSKLADLVS